MIDGPGDRPWEEYWRDAYRFVASAVPLVQVGAGGADERLALARHAHIVAKHSNSPELVSYAAQCLGHELAAARQREEARSVFELELAQRPASREAPLMRIELASWAVEEDELTPAVDLLSRAADDLEGRDPTETRLALAWAEVVQIDLETKLGRPDLAFVHLDAAQQRISALGLTAMQRECVLAEARLLLATDQVEALEPLLAEATEAGTFREDPVGEARLRLLAATSLVTRSRRRPELGERAVAMLEELACTPALPAPERTEAHLRLVDVLARRGELERAREELAVVVGAEARPRLTILHASLEGRLHLAGLAPGEAPDDVVVRRLIARYDDFLARAASVPDVAGGVGYLHFGEERSLLSTVIDVLLAARPGEAGRREAFVQLVRAQELGMMGRGIGPLLSGPGRSAEEVLEAARGLLSGPRSGMLLLLPGPNESHLFALDRGELTHHRLGARGGQLRATRRAYAAALAAGPAVGEPQERRERLRDAEEQLSELLLPGEVRRRLAGWSDLTLVGFDLIGTCLVESLPALERPGERLPIAHLPSLPLGAHLARCTARASAERAVARAFLGLSLERWDLWGLAAPTADASVVERFALEALPLQREHVDELTRAFAPDRARIRLGESASRAALLGADAARSRVVFVFAHGVVDRGRLRPAGLALSPVGEHDDGLVWSEDLQALDLSGAVVFLAACGAGRGPLRRGEDLGPDLGGALLAAGAQAVVVSPEELELVGALALAEVFLRELRGGAGPAAALDAARAELALDPRRSHPIHARLRVVGLGHVPLFPRSLSPTAAAAGR